MFNINLFFNSIVIIFLSIVLAACGDKFETVSGYTPEKFNKKGLDKQLKETIENMVFVKGGSFMMGCLDSKKSLEPTVLKYIGSEPATKQHFFFDYPIMPCKPENKVILDGFSIGKFEVSYGEYDLFTQETSLAFLQEKEFHYKVKLDKSDDSREGDKSANVGWHQANRYCEWLAKKTRLSFALPTEAQWEYAARSRGLNVPYATDTGYWNQGVNYPKFGFDENEEDGMTAKDMKYPPNPLGIYHMSDLMTEWVQDWYDENYYKYAPEKNPKGPDFGTEKILKGGGKGGIRHTPIWSRHPEPPLWDKEWMDIKIKAKESGRKIELNKENPTSHRYGFRCALNISKPDTLQDVKANK